MTWIQTRSGLAFDLLSPKEDQVCLADIAWAIGRIARYTGHGLRHCSVAEHSVRCSDIAERRHGPEAAWAALMHDAHEAYVGDVARPLKEAMRRRMLGDLDPFSRIEQACSEVVARKYGVTKNQEVPVIDVADLSVEAVINLRFPPPRQWALDVYATASAAIREDQSLWEEMPGNMTPLTASEAFLVRASELAPTRDTRSEAHAARLQVRAWATEAEEEVRLGSP